MLIDSDALNILGHVFLISLLCLWVDGFLLGTSSDLHPQGG